ncbi:hypothetical protein TSTA_000260 [Talaromyces stipitatus ATCC 10500]|uniref:Uncharacterized protein n=1 Tax=Talaromyces stipitatus (strain ATCC 10500 / CBS 375.48 / QM 6759 / NRRL 1006) TaxID=441959 RepID=B8MSF3_TALSN|nr:uncharacterized protein TSTA_000260 [Talaromyces stipitatus ATCC 10500]EED11948.1 hypothetical protein TSTA_000260 [Talaromyces stipitatus ATCC 10500]
MLQPEEAFEALVAEGDALKIYSEADDTIPSSPTTKSISLPSTAVKLRRYVNKIEKSIDSIKDILDKVSPGLSRRIKVVNQGSLTLAELGDLHRESFAKVRDIATRKNQKTTKRQVKASGALYVKDANRLIKRRHDGDLLKIYKSHVVGVPQPMEELTPQQLQYLNEMIDHGMEVLACQDQMPQPLPIMIHGSTLAKAQALLDRACLRLSIALLDHLLKGDLYESGLVGFLAVLGINSKKQTFQDADTYTPLLSGLIKIAQMMVVQEAVTQAEEEDKVEYSADALNQMRERFLIQNTTTSLKYIGWSEDQEQLTYKGLDMTMASFRHFIQIEIQQAQQSLKRLFLLHDEEAWEDIIPTIPLSQLKDNPTEICCGWNFL